MVPRFDVHNVTSNRIQRKLILLELELREIKKGFTSAWLSSSKKFHPACVGDNVIIPIQRPDRMTSLGQRNLLGVITGVGDSCYTIGARDGTLNNEYTRNQFDLCFSKFIQPSTVPCSSISQTSAMRNASLGIEGGSFCRCKYCKTNRYACKKAFRTCNTKCHQGHKCFNSWPESFRT